MSNIFKSILVGLALLISANAHAKLQEFEEVFTGTLPPIVSSEFGFYDEVATLLSGAATLTLYYQVVSDDPFSSIGSGTFTRMDALGAFSGDFFFYLSLSDEGTSLSGFLDQDRGSPLPNTGAYQYASAFGDAGAYGSGGGSITDQGNMTLNIKWQIRIPDPLTPVPEPQMSWLLLSGLVLLCLNVSKKRFHA